MKRFQPCIVRTTVLLRIEVPVRRGEGIGGRRKIGLNGFEVVAVPLKRSYNVIIPPILAKQKSHQKSGTVVWGTGSEAMPISEFGFSAQLASIIGPSTVVEETALSGSGFLAVSGSTRR